MILTYDVLKSLSSAYIKPLQKSISAQSKGGQQIALAHALAAVKADLAFAKFSS